MVAFSKLFEVELRHRPCTGLFHSGPCLQHHLRNIYTFAFSNAKYYVPICFIPLLVRLRQLDRKLLKETLEYYGFCVAESTLVGYTFSIMMCIFRHIFGEFKYWNMFFLPGMIAGLWNFIQNPRSKRLASNSLTQSLIESILIQRRNVITRTIANSIPLQTSIFMCLSALILHAKQNKTISEFWIVKPCAKTKQQKQEQSDFEDEIETDKADSVCAHSEESCFKYLKDGAVNYFIVGLTLDLVKMALTSTPAELPKIWKLVIKLNSMSLWTAAFLTSYITIYRFTHCYLNRNWRASAQRNHLIAGLLGGASYVFMPKLTLFSYALVLSSSAVGEQLLNSTKLPQHNKCVQILKHLPVRLLLMSFSLGYIVHTYVQNDSWVNNLGIAIINGVTNNKATKIKLKFEEIERSMEKVL